MAKTSPPSVSDSTASRPEAVQRSAIRKAVPGRLIARIAKFRAKEIEEREKTKAVPTQSRS
jgi:hypothetical protein